MNIHKIKRIAISVICCMLVANTYAQGQADRMKQIFSEIKALDNYGYQYTVNALFPDGTKDHMKGEIYASAEKKIMYNTNDAYTAYCTGKWLYQAWHQDKQVIILNLQGNTVKPSAKNDLFKNDFFSQYVDSFLLRYAKIESFTEANNIADLKLSFPEGSIRSMQVVYNTADHIPVSLIINVFQKDETQRKNNVGTTQVITCSKYARYPRRSEIAEYFSIKNGKPILNKYKNYKVQATL